MKNQNKRINLLYHIKNQRSHSNETKQKADKLSHTLYNPQTCLLCCQNYSIASNLPRIMVQCGHTLCSDCVSRYIKDNYLICPFCQKCLKNVKNPESLPVNQQIFIVFQKNSKSEEQRYESKSSTIEESNVITLKSCRIHKNNMNHYFCSTHKDLYCEVCVNNHKVSTCKIIDVYQSKDNELFHDDLSDM